MTKPQDNDKGWVRHHFEKRRAALEAELNALNQKRAELEAQLTVVNTALDAVKQDPDLEAVVDAISRTL